MVGIIIWVLLEIYLAFQQRKNFENTLRIDKIDKALFNYVQCPRNYCDGVTLNQCLINNNK